MRNGLAPIIIVFIIAALVLGGGVLYLSRQQATGDKEQRERACTTDVERCPDGSFISRTGPNCEFSVCPETMNTNMGTLAGRVSIGPICPVERIDQPCTAPPEAYASREFLVLSSDQSKTVASFRANASGTYSVSLQPGTYVVVSAKTGIGYISKDLPRAITINAGQTANLDINVDTGIR